MSATVIVKIIGYFFKVPLKGIIGVSGFGYFNAAYGLFNTLYALSVAGMPVAGGFFSTVCLTSAKNLRRRAENCLLVHAGSCGYE